MSLFPRAKPTKATGKREPKLPPVRVHVFAQDREAVDGLGRRICTCGQIEAARCHTLPPVSDEAAEVARRMTGDD